MISVFKESKSTIERLRKFALPKPNKAYKRLPDRIIELSEESPPRRLQNSEQKLRKTIRENHSPSLLHSRAKLSPVREIERDDYIDTADILLNQEIDVINKLIQKKESIFASQYPG